MDKEKTYSVVGKVEIGTDEYRDLIEDAAALRAQLDRASSERYSEYCRANEAERNLKASQNAVALYKDFVNSSELIKAEYIKFIGSIKTESEEE